MLCRCSLPLFVILALFFFACLHNDAMASGIAFAASAAQSPARKGAGHTPGTAGTTKLAWDPVTDERGKRPGNLAGYRIYYGNRSRTYTHTIDAGPATEYAIKGLKPGTYYFAVRAYDRDGRESAFSKEVSKQVR